MKGPHNHRLYPVLVSSDEDGQEDPTAQDEHEEDEDTADEDALHSNSNNLRPSQPEIRMEPNSIYERRKAQVMLERKWSARRQRARERQRSSEAVFKYSLWQRSVLSIGVGVVVGIALVAILLWNREERLSGEFLDCSERAQGRMGLDEVCVDRRDLPHLLPAIQRIRRNLTESLGLSECGVNVTWPLNATFRQLKAHVAGSAEPVTLAESALYLIRRNPHWGIRLVNDSGHEVTTWTLKNISSIILSPSYASKGIWCQFKHGLHLLWWWVAWIAAALFLVLGGYSSLQWYIRRREEMVRATFIMVDRIMEVLRRHYDATKRDKNLLPYLAIVHVRDMLLAPSERKYNQKIWDRSVDWLATHESRVRVETRQIAGEEFMVWRWIQIDPPPTENPALLERENFWQGTAHGHYPPDLSDKIAPPSGQPTQCIRLKNMFETIKKLDPKEVQMIESSVLDKCIRHGGVIHIKVDKRSPYGCVYLKLDSVRTAVEAYKVLHGGWFKGKLITAKYIQESKYHRWFPESAKAKKFLYPPD